MKWTIIFLISIFCLAAINRTTPGLASTLSSYQLDAGAISYKLATPLFTDYAEKARLIKLPPGATLTITGDGLPNFPDGAILAKTFFYWRDKRDTTKGKQLVETRILLKSENGWLAGTYVWNNEQTEATLTPSGQKTPINYLDEAGEPHNINYRIPSTAQCVTCHQSNKEIIPIGFKIRNLNNKDQLARFASKGILSSINPAAYSTVPAWDDTTQSLEKRARAYLDVNCAHCHNEKGFCSQSEFRPAYENPLQQTHIVEERKRILNFLRSGRMPLIGTTIVHREGLLLLEQYLNQHK